MGERICDEKAIVLAGSRGIGKAISAAVGELDYNVVWFSSKTLDTSDLSLVKEFINNEKETDILVLNTGGPPAKGFFDITEEDWDKYYR